MQPSLGFCQSIKSVICSNYANFNGRARRSEFWYFFLFIFLMLFSIYLFGINIMPNTNSGIVQTIALMQALIILIFFITFIPYLALIVRRFHDTGRSGWYIFVSIVPLVGSFLLLYFMTLDSDPSPNQYGPSPKYGAYNNNQTGNLMAQNGPIYPPNIIPYNNNYPIQAPYPNPVVQNSNQNIIYQQFYQEPIQLQPYPNTDQQDPNQNIIYPQPYQNPIPQQPYQNQTSQQPYQTPVPQVPNQI